MDNGRKVFCDVCNELVPEDDARKFEEETPQGFTLREYVCNKCLKGGE